MAVNADNTSNQNLGAQALGGKRYVRVLIPVRLQWIPTYSTTDETITPGERVSVVFAHKQYAGVVVQTDVQPDVDESKISPIQNRLDELEAISPEELKFWEFLSSYYMCTMGEVFKNAYPLGRVNSEQTAGLAKERARSLKERTRAVLLQRRTRVLERLSKKDAALEGKHKESVTKRLSLERSRICDELQAVESALAAVQQALDSISSGTHAKKSSPAVSKHKPQVLVAPASERFAIYRQKAKECLSRGSSVLLMVPDITLTLDFEKRLSDEFGELLLVFHSQETAARRRRIADELRSGVPHFVLGTRSAVYLPFNGLGLVMIDEEQDVSFKQTELAPRYNGRDAAVVLASIHGAEVLMGSSAPSLETFLNCESGRYSKVRYSLGTSSCIEVLDTHAEKAKRGMHGIFSRKALAAIKSALDEARKIVVLRSWDDPAAELKEVFGPRSAEIQVLPLWKTNSLDGVSLIVVPQADSLFGKDNFRSDERAFQTLCRLSDAVSLSPAGKLIVQTSRPGHPAIQALLSGNVRDYYLHLLDERRDFSLPPFTRAVDIQFKDTDQARLNQMLSALAAEMSAFSCMISKSCLHLYLEKDALLQENKAQIMQTIANFEKSQRYAGHIIIDIDSI